LQQIFGDIIGFMGSTIQQMLSVKIGVINRHGSYSNHYCNILDFHRTFWNLMEVIATASHMLELTEIDN
jgi:hypothetical protein